MLKYYSPRLFSFFALVTISSLCLLFDMLTRINFNKIELPKDQPEYNAVDVEGKIYDKGGKLAYKLLSKTAWEFPHDEKVFMTDMQVYLYQENSDAVQYYLTTKEGWVNYSEKKGYLGQSTEVIVYGSKPQKNIMFYGKNINFDMNHKFFVSDDDVKAVQDKNMVMAHGFSYDYNKQFLRLSSKVRIRYVQE